MDAEALLSVLCQEPCWIFDIEFSEIRFKKDNTGLLCAGYYPVAFICSPFDWKISSVEPCTDGQSSPSDESVRLIAEFQLDMTLSNSLPQGSGMEKSTMVNAGCLMDNAFQSKSFKIKMEEGQFSRPAEELSPYDNPFPMTWSKRLIFDHPPYPPEHEWKESWKEMWKMPEGEGWNYWQARKFVGFPIEKKKDVH